MSTNTTIKDEKETPIFVFQSARPKLSDPLRSKPTVLIAGTAAAANGEVERSGYLFAVDPGQLNEVYIAEKGSAWWWLRLGLSRWFVTGLVWPLELSSTINQVEFVPNDAYWLRIQAGERQLTQEAFPEAVIPNNTDQATDDDDSSTLDSDDPDYYNPNRLAAAAANKSEKKKPTKSSKKLPVDKVGYVSTNGLYQSYHLPGLKDPNSGRGALSVFRALWAHPDEGLRSNWKGHPVHVVHHLAFTNLQVPLNIWLNDRLGWVDVGLDPFGRTDFEAAKGLITLVGSHLMMGTLLQPLELVKTRMILQTHHRRLCRYDSWYQALVEVYQTEHQGQLSSLYATPSLLIPTLLFYTFSPLFEFGAPLMIQYAVGCNAVEAPVTFAFYEFLWQSLGTLITMPIDTVRKRLFLQVRGGQRPLECCVPIRQDLEGIADCFFKIVKDEGGRKTALKGKSPPPPVTFWESWGVQGLYRGFTTTCLLNAATSLVHLMGGTNQHREEW